MGVQAQYGAWGIALKVTMVALCVMIMNGLGYTGDAIAALVFTLLALSCASLAEWLWWSHPELSGMPGLVFCSVALAYPPLIALIAVTTFDAGRIGAHLAPVPRTLSKPDSSAADTYDMAAGMEGTRPVRRNAAYWLLFAQRWCWIAPIMLEVLAVRFHWHNGTVPSARQLWLSAMLAMISWISGAAYGRMIQVARRQIAMQDELRELQRRWRAQLTDANQERALSVRSATLSERTRIAREIHDNVGHILTRGVMQAQAGLVVARSKGELAACGYLESVQGSLDEAMTMVRRSVHDLDDEGTDFNAAIDSAAHCMDAAVSGSHPLGFSVRLENHIQDAPSPVARCLAGVIREALSNAVRHGHAHTATVVLHDYPALWQMVVFNPIGERAAPGSNETTSALTAHADPRGMGLADIEMRVRTLEGTSLVGPYEDGWRVFVSIPKTPWDTTQLDTTLRDTARENRSPGSEGHGSEDAA